MTRIFWLAAFALTTAGIVNAQTADTRWKLRVHILYDAGLKIEEFEPTYGTLAACDIAGGLKEISFARRRIMASALCMPIHIVSPGKDIVT